MTTATDRAVIDQLAVDVRSHLKGWATQTTTQANGLPMIVLTDPEGVEYHAGRRWCDRNRKDRVAVWPANVDHTALAYVPGTAQRVAVPEATMRADRGGKALAQTVRKVTRAWEPLRAQMLEARAERQKYENAKQATRERVLEAMGDQARPTEEGGTLYVKADTGTTRIEARAYDDCIRLEYMSLPADVALDVIKLIRERTEG